MKANFKFNNASHLRQGTYSNKIVSTDTCHIRQNTSYCKLVINLEKKVGHEKSQEIFFIYLVFRPNSPLGSPK